MTTLREIAAQAGVHVATASAVLNSAGGNTRVSSQTRERVLAAARKLAYIPNESARRLRTGRSNTVGFLGGDLRNPFFAELTAALETALSECDQQLIVSHVAHPDVSTVEKATENLQRQGVDRIIRWEESSLAMPTSKAAKSEILSIGFTSQERPGVWLDLEYAIQICVESLAARGFQQLGFFYPQKQKESPSARIRSRAFSKICKKQRLPDPVLASYQGESWDLEAAGKGARKVRQDYPAVEAWLAFNDVAGLGLLSQLPIKKSSRVLCFDGTALARCWPGTPTYLNLQIAELAQKAALTVAGKLAAKNLGNRANWIRPTLVN